MNDTEILEVLQSHGVPGFSSACDPCNVRLLRAVKECMARALAQPCDPADTSVLQEARATLVEVCQNRGVPLPEATLARIDQAIGAVPGCACEFCKPNTVFVNMRMIVCAICGNKRCPHATHHDNPCTGSNAPGQKGSSWEHVEPFK